MQPANNIIWYIKKTNFLFFIFFNCAIKKCLEKCQCITSGFITAAIWKINKQLLFIIFEIQNK